MGWEGDGGVYVDDTEFVLPGPIHNHVGVFHLRRS